MNIEKTLADGCDKTSRVYGNMLTMLEDVMRDEEKLRELGPLDFSALGMYIGKFVEQEINSSVVQIMRAFRGVSMPEYYCKRFPGIVEYVDSPGWDDNELRRNFLKDYGIDDEDYDENLYYEWYDEEMARIRCSGLRWIRARYSIDDQVSMEELPDYTEDIQVAFLP